MANKPVRRAIRAWVLAAGTAAVLFLVGLVALAQATARVYATPTARCSAETTPLKSRSRPYRQLLAVDSRAEVYTLGAGPPSPPGTRESPRGVYGCVYGHVGAYRLGKVLEWVEYGKYMEGALVGDSREVLSGSVVAYEYRRTPTNGGSVWAVMVRNLSTGQVLRDEPTGHFPTPFSFEFGIGRVTGLVLKTDGSVAWLVKASAEVFGGECQVHVADKSGSRVLAAGTEIAPESLALAGSTIYWTEAGKPYAATLE